MRSGFAKGIHLGWRVLRWVVVAWLVATAMVVLGSAFAARSLPDLEPWHRWTFPGEPDAGRLRDMDWAEYLRAEQAVFDQLSASTKVSRPTCRGDRVAPG